MDGPLNVFVASSDVLFKEVVARFLERREGWSCAGTAGDGMAALPAIGRARPDAVLATEGLARLGGAALAGQVERKWPGTTVVVLGNDEVPGAVVLDPASPTEDVLAALATRVGPRSQAPATERRRELARLATLTKRERVVLKLLANGATLSGAAEDLGVSENTIRTHMQNVYEKIDCHSRLELVRFAERHGLTADAPDAG